MAVLTVVVDVLVEDRAHLPSRVDPRPLNAGKGLRRCESKHRGAGSGQLVGRGVRKRTARGFRSAPGGWAVLACVCFFGDAAAEGQKTCGLRRVGGVRARWNRV